MEQMAPNHRWQYLVQGTVSLILGLMAIVVPHWFTLGVEQLIGVLFFASGILQVFRISQFFQRLEFWSTLLIALLQMLIGIYLVAFPLSGMLVLTRMLILFFLADGAFKIYLASQLKPYRGWFWPIFSAIASWAIAGIILAAWPDTAFWTLGVLAGLYLMGQGISQIAVGFSSHDFLTSP